MEQEIYNKEYTIGKILSESWRRFKENFRLILLITLIVYTPINIITNILLARIPTDTLQDVLQIFKTHMRAIQILESLIGIIATMAIAYAIKNQIDGKSISIGEALMKSLSKWGAAIGTNIIFTICIAWLTLLLIIPGIIYYVYWAFASYVVILQNKSGISALSYSKAIVKGRWWKVAGYSLVFGLLMVSIGLIIGAMYWFLPDNFLINITTDTTINVALAFFTVVFTIFFINLDGTKKESVARQNHKF